NNGSSDACGVASLALSKVDFDCSNVGANTVTLTVTDVNGNTSTADAVVTVVDAVAPVAVAQNVTVQLSASGIGSTTAAAVNNGSSDACGVASLTLSKVDFDCSNVGANTVTLTVTDVNGNTSTVDAVVTVVDTVSPVAIAQNISVTLVNGSVMVSGEQVDNGSSDACGIVSRTVVPNMFNCSNIGPNPVLLTVSDANGNSSTIQAVVNVIGAIPTVSISEGVQPVFTQGGAIVLTASSPTATSYLWTGGPATASYFVYASGTYTVRATNEFGCFVDGSRTVTYNASSLLSSYVILAKEEVELEDNVVVASGGVGVTSSCGEIEVKGNSTVTNSTTFARARYITVSSNSSVTSRTSTAVPSSLRPTFSFNPYCNTSSSSSCGSRGSSSSTVTSRNINVAQNASVVITDSVIGNVVIGKNATVTFSAPRIYMREMFINDDASVIFSECATIRICNKLDIKKNVDFNTTNSKLLIIYVEDKFTVSEGSNINARVYTLDEMKVKGKSSAPVTMTGMFIAEEVKAEKYVTFNWNTNTTCNTVISKTEVEAVEDGLITNYFDVEVYPNPSVDAFNLRLLSSSDMPFSVTIYDMNGKLIETINVDQSTLSSELGAGYAEGMYIMLVNQGDQNKTLRLVKSRR
ncbi:MAG: T9SS type A sorting domain-containing protein, partial [Bacteroidia bacterium]|nr:T9SS type A sorting domain-containing protein [Bacteroidia bacterium]